jgi:hypothetical protein
MMCGHDYLKMSLRPLLRLPGWNSLLSNMQISGHRHLRLPAAPRKTKITRTLLVDELPAFGSLLMFYRLIFGIMVLAWASPSARADNLSIDLEVKTAGASKTAESEITALGVKPKGRGVLEAKAGKPVTIKYTVTSTAEKGKAKDVVVHCFVVKIDRVGQAAVPKLDKDVAAECALTMDFDPKDVAKGELNLTLDQPGVYLLRVETIGAAKGAEGHEHFAALDLVIK